MPWAKIDDGLTDHPKVDTLLEDDELHGLAAIGLWTLMLAHTAKQLTDGAAGHRTVRRIAPEHGQALAEALERAGMLEKTDDGWLIHDYLDYNPSRDKVLEERRAGAERQAKSRARRAVQPDVDTESQRDSQNQSQRDSHRDSHRESPRDPTRPDPTRPDTTDQQSWYRKR